MTTEERISEWMQGREDELVEALVPLIAAESTRSDAKPGKPFGEGPALALERAMELTKRWGFRTENHEGYVGTADLNDREDGLHILAHLDVVGAGDGWDTDPYCLIRDGDLIYGRGTDDDKGPLVAALLGMRCVRELGLPLKKMPSSLWARMRNPAPRILPTTMRTIPLHPMPCHRMRIFL